MYEWVWNVGVNIISIQGCLGVCCGDVIFTRARKRAG